jgi:hypothetical protein
MDIVQTNCETCIRKLAPDAPPEVRKILEDIFYAGNKSMLMLFKSAVAEESNVGWIALDQAEAEVETYFERRKAEGRAHGAG